MTVSSEEMRGAIKKWADHIDGIDADSGHGSITERRVLAFVIRDNVGVLLKNKAGRPAEMRARRYRPEVMWAAADLAVRSQMRRADEFARRVCEFVNISRLEEGEKRYLESAYGAALRGIKRPG